MRLRWVYLLAWLLGCGEVRPSQTSDAPQATAMCDPTAKFGAPVPVMKLATIGLTGVETPRLSPDELTLYLDGFQPGNPSHLYVAHRNSLTEPFGTPTLLTAAYSEFGSGNASVTADGLALWLALRPASTEGYHLYVATRSSSLVEFGPPQKADVVNATDVTITDAQPFMTADGEELWFESTRAPSMGGNDLWRAPRSGTGFAAPVHVAGLSSSSNEYYPTLSADRLTIYFSSNRPAVGARGGIDVWSSHRRTADEDFPTPALVDEFNTMGNDYVTWLSADNCRIYGASNSSGSDQIFMATRH